MDSGTLALIIGVALVILIVPSTRRALGSTLYFIGCVMMLAALFGGRRR